MQAWWRCHWWPVRPLHSQSHTGRPQFEPLPFCLSATTDEGWALKDAVPPLTTKGIASRHLLSPNSWSVTKLHRTNATTLTKRKPSYFQNSASTSLITFAEIRYLVCLCRRDQPGMGHEAPLLTSVWTVLRCLMGGVRDLPNGNTSPQPEPKNGATTSALLWSNLRNVCTFSAVTLTCFLASVVFSSLTLVFFVLFLLFWKVWPKEEAGTGTGWWPRPLTLHTG